ncbi:E3 ubiquitin-protein ligase NEURL3-like isoform X2 [Dicentrarchus labrax]|uniref:E3 ubiquitin-protein ligase NEURL3 n=1 Tax=Dicentrarchus labrax TaxID=13489 RepID=A0A8P4K886_DICLA|nr:E3 ubiquitin-protein ligase NEURL3-like isoform X2 [Dicentrarchus labrax]XP_051279329.1 E3 ubiquitin-protein ligase NEURL3-like isoform X2 [Dicentrarchus labrax]
MSVDSERTHRCGLSCLGPLTFHGQAVGVQVCLSHGRRLAERRESTFKNGLVFSSRPVKIQERIRLRVQKDLSNWHGALRLGFTNIPPSERSQPLPTMAIPNLTDTPGHWAAPVPESYCRAGSELEFWVSEGGNIYIANESLGWRKIFTGVDLSKPLWAMVDIYGQTCSVLLLGSEIRGQLQTRRSCPAPDDLLSTNVDNHYSWISDGYSDDSMSCLDVDPADEDSVKVCVVCMGRKARNTLPCGHRCLCIHCISRVILEFGSCPLCRHKIIAPLAGMGMSVSGVV